MLYYENSHSKSYEEEREEYERELRDSERRRAYSRYGDADDDYSCHYKDCYNGSS